MVVIGLPVQLSVIIVSYNTVEYLRRCLISLAAHPPSVPHEIIVVDNASTDGSVEVMAAGFPAIQVIRRATNDGYGVALNAGAGVATGSLLMFLNPDIEVSVGSMDELCRFVVDNPRVGVVGPRLQLADGSPQASAKYFCSPWRLALEASRAPLLMPKTWRGRLLLGTYFDQSKTRKVPWISGACHVVPKAVWDEVGGLTEATFCGFDDYDYCVRVHAKGYQVWLDAESTMTHHGSVAVRDRWSPWEVEQVAIHNTYVVLGSHWPRWRVKAYLIAEIATYESELLRIWLSPTSAPRLEYDARLRQRLRLLQAFLTGREQPRQRFGATSVNA